MRLVVGAALIVVLAAACSTFSSDDPAADPNDGGPEASRDDAGDGGGPSCRVIFVAPDGSDGDDGCAPGRAKRTIGSAIARVKAEKLEGREIHVCTGTYAEDVILDVPVSLHGGYSCNKFERAGASRRAARAS